MPSERKSQVVGNDPVGAVADATLSAPRLEDGTASALPPEVASEILDYGAKIAKIGAWDYDFENNRIFWTEGVFEIFDLRSEHAPLYDEAIKYYVPEDRERLVDALEQAKAGGTEADLTCRIISEKGRHKFVRVIIRPASFSAGRVDRLRGVVQDVTAREMLRRGMESFFAMTPDLVGALDLCGRPINVSPSWTSVLGWSEAELKKQGILKFVHESEREQMSRLMTEVLEARVVHHIESRVRIKSGGYRWFSWRFFGDDVSKMIFVSARDISNRKEVENALLEAKLQAEEANSAKSDFLAVMSHELRTPLNPILGFTDLLMEETDNPEHKEILASISEAGQNLTKVIGDVLDFAKIESGRSEVIEEAFDVAKLLETKVRFMRGQIKGKAIELVASVEVSDQFANGQRFVGDAEKISRVLTNLVSNAIKFTDQGSVRVEAFVAKTDDTAMLHVDVSDTGIGISESSLQDVFEPFRQVDSSRTRRHGGTGLGLAICKRLVELMGGSISVKRGPEGGSVFSYFVPLRLAERPTDVVEDGFNVQAWARSLAGEEHPHVLLVEDNETNTFYAKHILKTFNCDVTAVASGEQALAQYSVGEHDLILLDLHMPGIGGLEVLRSIRRSEDSLGWRRVPIIVLTADVLTSMRDKALNCGADAVMNKPIRMQELAEALSAHLGATA